MSLALFLDKTSELQLQQQLRDVQAQLLSQENKNRELTDEHDRLAKYISATTFYSFLHVCQYVMFPAVVQ